MPEESPQLESTRGPRIVAPTNRVSVAFPFSHLHIAESSRELVDLASIVARLALLTETLAPSREATEVRESADPLAATLHERAHCSLP
jgi:hypothetical protein